MLDLLLSRPAMISFAVLGAALSLASSMLGPRVSVAVARRLNQAGYACMIASMLIFVAAGIFPTGRQPSLSGGPSVSQSS